MRYYFLDTNMIIAFIKGNPQIVELFDNPNVKCFYTETVRAELHNPIHRYIIPDKFQFVNSNIGILRMKAMFDDITGTLGHTQITKFRNDLAIVFEAGYVCYDATPADDFTEPLLLTQNLIDHPVLAELLEDLVNLHGFEHLITVQQHSSM